MRLQRRLCVRVGTSAGIGASAGAGESDSRLARAKFRQATRRGRADLRALDDRRPHLVRIWLGVLVGNARSRESV